MSTQTTHTFETQVAELLHLVTHSLYSNPDIFLRELISNASDACDKLRFLATTDESLYEGRGELGVKIYVNTDKKTLTLSDSGIGMTQDEAIENLGTIAKSGTKAFLSQLEDAKNQNLIGQFGVGFYSGFIVADQIEVITKKAGASEATRWVSKGTGSFTTETTEKEHRGTDIILHLKDEYTQGEHNYLDKALLKRLVKTYSDHINLPIMMKKDTWQEDEEGQGQTIETDEWETVNAEGALWTRSPSEIEDDEYRTFYKNLGHYDAPLTWSHNRVEGRLDYTQLLFIPEKAPHDLYHQASQNRGLKLYVKRVFIMDDASELLPNYLRFVKGVVDAQDLPLNVSREILQASRDVKTIKEGNTRRILGMIDKLAKGEDYDAFYREFGDVIKEGLAEDMGNQAKIAQLLRYPSTLEASTSFEAYKERMKEGQKAIYYLTSESLSAAKNSPLLELFKKKGIEVILMGAPIDAFAMGFLHSFDGLPMKDLAKGGVDISEFADEEDKKSLDDAKTRLTPVIDKLKGALTAKATDVKVSSRLVDSPACLVTPEGAPTPQMVQMMRAMGQEMPVPKPILEINAEHPLVKKLESTEAFDDLANVLFDQALLADGGTLEDPSAYLARVQSLLLKQ